MPNQVRHDDPIFVPPAPILRRSVLPSCHPGLDPGSTSSLLVPKDGGCRVKPGMTIFGKLAPPVPLRADPEPERIQPDEAGGVALVVAARAFLEGDEVLVVERCGLSRPMTVALPL